MRWSKRVLILFLCVTSLSYSQKKISKTFVASSKEINIYTEGLDNLILENSNSDVVEVFLMAESYDEQLINVENSLTEANIKFAFKGTETREVVFRKYITKRLQRANAIVKIPKNKSVYVFGENVDIESKNIDNDLAIYIDNGIVKLNKIQAKTTLKLYSGNVYAAFKNTLVDVKSANGKIRINDVEKKNEYKKTPSLIRNQLTISSIKANLFLKTF